MGLHLTRYGASNSYLDAVVQGTWYDARAVSANRSPDQSEWIRRSRLAQSWLSVQNGE